MPSQYQRRVVGKSAAYAVAASRDRAKSIFTTRDAAGAVTFTLPPPGYNSLGTEFEFVSVRDQNLTVAGAAAGDLCTFNNAAAASVAASTAGQKIGARIRAICVETVTGTFKWLVTGVSVGVTYTVA